MQGVSYSGLAGKARRVRERSRAARLQTNQLIMDYFDPESDASAERFNRAIPISRRRDSLLPSSPTFEHVAYGTDEQLELPLSDPDLVQGEAVCRIAARATRIETAAPTPHQGREDNASAKATDAGGSRPVGAVEDSPTQFTISGFLCGCSIGVAVAAVILLVVQAALR